MDRTLRYGARGDEVVTLQQGLNRLPSSLAPLATDGIYGAKSVARVKEFQGSHSLSTDGVVGTNTWGMLFELLSKLVPTPPSTDNPYDVLRANVIPIARRFIGWVDFNRFGPDGRPMGIDFIKLIYLVAASVHLTDENFKYPKSSQKSGWSSQPYIGGKPDAWCGIFCVYCYRMAGFLDVRWRTGLGPSEPVKRVTFYPGYGSRIRTGDIGSVKVVTEGGRIIWHYFLIDSVNGDKTMVSVDGNQRYGSITERADHRIGQNQFNYFTVG